MRSALTLRKKDRADQTVCSCRGERADHGSRPSPLQLREHGAAPGPPTRAWSRASAGPGGWSPAPRSSCSSPSPRCHRTGNGPQGSRHRVRGRDRAGRDHTARAACARPDGRVQDLELAAACLGPVGRCRFDAPGDPPRLDGSSTTTDASIECNTPQRRKEEINAHQVRRQGSETASRTSHRPSIRPTGTAGSCRAGSSPTPPRSPR